MGRDDNEDAFRSGFKESRVTDMSLRRKQVDPNMDYPRHGVVPPPRKKRWIVFPQDAASMEITADHLDIRDGCLVFLDGIAVILALAPGQWVQASLVEEAEVV